MNLAFFKFKVWKSYANITAWLVMGCVVMRSISFLIFGVRKGTDSLNYIQRAKEFSMGIIPQMSGTTHQPLFSLLLAPAYLFHIDIEEYFILFSLFISVISLFLVNRLSTFESKTRTIVSSILFILLPSTNFWSVYILSDSTFVFTLLLYLYSCATFLDSPRSLQKLILWILSSLLMFGVRLHAIPILGATTVYFILKEILVDLTVIRRFFLSIALSGFFLVVGVVLLLQQPWLADKLLNNASFNQSLWFSTQRVTNIDQMISTHAKEYEINRLSQRSHYQVSSANIKARQAMDFISQKPFRYLLMAGERFICFWFPWIYAKNWSSLHLLLDVLISLFLFLGLLLSYPSAFKENDFNALKVLCILSLCLQVAFYAADTDARYRFPVEILSFSLALDGWKVLWERIKICVSRTRLGLSLGISETTVPN